MISFIHVEYKNKKIKQTNRTKTNLQRQTSDWWLVEGKESGGKAKQVKELNCMMTEENQTFVGEHNVVHTDIDL